MAFDATVYEVVHAWVLAATTCCDCTCRSKCSWVQNHPDLLVTLLIAPSMTTCAPLLSAQPKRMDVQWPGVGSNAKPPNAGLRLYGGAAFERCLAEFQEAALELGCPAGWTLSLIPASLFL